MDQITISFRSQEGACRRLIRLVEWKGGRVNAIRMTQDCDGDLSRLHLKYTNIGGDERSHALVEKIREIHGVVTVTSGECA